jgi:MFS transporter, AAHS family, 4-hydroxybenzoate transporter
MCTPRRVRATGTASALAFGRLGAILSAFAGAAAITAGGASAYLAMLGLAMTGVLIALLVLKRHIPSAAHRERMIETVNGTSTERHAH